MTLFRKIVLIAGIYLAAFLSPSALVAQNSPALFSVSQLAPSADTVRVLNPGAAEPLVLVSQDAEKKLLLFKVSKGSATKVGETNSLGHVWKQPWWQALLQRPF